MKDRTNLRIAGLLEQLIEKLGITSKPCPDRHEAFSDEERRTHTYDRGYCDDGVWGNGYYTKTCSICHGYGEVIELPTTA